MPSASRRPLLRKVGIAAAVPIALLLVFLVAGTFYRPNTAIPAGFRGTHVLVGGSPVRVLQVGQGPDVVLIHGSPGFVEDWEPVMNALAGSFRFTAFDRPGQGFSGDTGKYSIEENADTALALMDTLGIAHAIVVGHSYGGPIALALTARAPSRVDACVVVDAVAYRTPRDPPLIMRLAQTPLLGVGMNEVLGPLLAPALDPLGPSRALPRARPRRELRRAAHRRVGYAQGDARDRPK